MDSMNTSIETVMKGFGETMTNLVSGFNSMILVMKQFSETMDKFSGAIQTKIETFKNKMSKQIEKGRRNSKFGRGNFQNLLVIGTGKDRKKHESFQK